MWNVEHPTLGAVSFEGGDGYFSAVLPLASGQVVEVEIEGVPDPTVQAFVTRCVSSLDALDRATRAVLAGETGTVSEDVSFYLEHHLAELPGEVLRVLEVESVEEATVQRLVARLEVCIVQIIATRENQGVQIDYSLDSDVTNYLLVACLDSEGQVEYVTVES